MSNLSNELKTTMETEITDGKLTSVTVKTTGTLSNGELFFASNSFYPQPEHVVSLIQLTASPEYIAACNYHRALFKQAKEEIYSLSSANTEREDATTIDSITIYTHAGPFGSIET